jgi:hypothetical protein
MSEIITKPILEVDNRAVKVTIPVDRNTADDQLKLKIRDINLIKHNPNHFTNRGQFTEMLGGQKTQITVLVSTLGFYFYRWQANRLRHFSFREGLWMKHYWAMTGFAYGLFLSSVFFFQHQRIMNDIVSNHLLKRFKDSQQLDRKHIWEIRDIPNDDDCYHFTSTFIKSYPH